MKTSFYYLIILVLALLACTTPKKTISSYENKSTIVVNCKNSSVPASYITGKVTDINTQKEIFNARAVLRDLKTLQVIEGVLTDEHGNFKLSNISLGQYNLRIEHEGCDDVDINLNFDEHRTCLAEIKLALYTMKPEKPIIYLYPEQRQKINVKLDYEGTLSHSYPKYYGDGWTVTAEPNGTLWDENNQEYYALFWESHSSKQIIPQDGFIVAGKETASFLEEKLAYLGLNRREANEFIMYWLPRMENIAYNLIHFAGTEYEEQAELEIRPKPETIIRVMMLTQPLKSKIDYPKQDLTKLKKTRKGFTVVEWGGSTINIPNL
ncbi:MAG: carboxypeptidase-like regulatory domain-containing protein [Bacteroidia bacterium]|nr:carboxypeptidase-like regulatory domain-containing protein [Bacteroidia bacterium]